MKLKNEKEALKVFCDECRPHLSRPFINDKDNGRLFASDGYVMVLIDPSLLQEEYETDSQRIPELGIEFMSQDILLDDIEAACKNINLIPEKKPKDGILKDCPECDGTGTVEYEYVDQGSHHHYKECDCPVCGGDGINPKYEMVETGKMIVPPKTVFHIGDVYFNAQLVQRCLWALRVMGFNRMTWKYASPIQANIFDICDGFKFVLMPVHVDQDTPVVEVPITPPNDPINKRNYEQNRMD